LQWRVERVARVDDDSGMVDGMRVPTLAQVGELYVFVLDARARLAEAEGYVAMIEGRLGSLDTVRLLREAAAAAG
jgi:hypothetical protein